MYVVTIDREDTYCGMSPTIEGTLTLIDFKTKRPDGDLHDESGRIAYLHCEGRTFSWRKYGSRELLYEFPASEVDKLR